MKCSHFYPGASDPVPVCYLFKTVKRKSQRKCGFLLSFRFVGTKKNYLEIADVTWPWCGGIKSEGELDLGVEDGSISF